MDNWIFIFILNLIGGVLVFVGLNLILGLIEGTVDTIVLVGVFLFIQLSFVSTLLFQVLHRLKK